MKYYKDKNNQVFAFESDGSQDHLITDDMVKMTKAQIKEHLNPKPSSEQIKANRIAELQQLLRELDIKRVRPLAEGDTEYLKALNAQAIELRQELRTLENDSNPS